MEQGHRDLDFFCQDGPSIKLGEQRQGQKSDKMKQMSYEQN